jgi:hypothetical protein
VYVQQRLIVDANLLKHTIDEQMLVCTSSEDAQTVPVLVVIQDHPEIIESQTAQVSQNPIPVQSVFDALRGVLPEQTTAPQVSLAQLGEQIRSGEDRGTLGALEVKSLSDAPEV